MNKISILRSQKHQLLRLYRVSPLWRQEFKWENQIHIPSQVKSALRKFREGRIVTAIYSGPMYLYCTCLLLHIWLNRPLYLLHLNALTWFFRLQITEWENDEPCEQYLLDRNVSISNVKIDWELLPRLYRWFHLSICLHKFVKLVTSSVPVRKVYIEQMFQRSFNFTSM